MTSGSQRPALRLLWLEISVSLIVSFPTVTLTKGLGSFWGERGGRLTVKLSGILSSPSSEGHGLPFIQRVLDLHTGSFGNGFRV